MDSEARLVTRCGPVTTFRLNRPASLNALAPNMHDAQGVSRLCRKAATGLGAMTAKSALDGVRVIDFASELSGSVAALMLAEVGAEVVKVEPPQGDARRGSAAFAAWNRSKQSIALDIGGVDRATFDSLLAGADILIHDTPEGAARALGLDAGTLAVRAPHLISSWIRGVPKGIAEGPLPTDDFLVLAARGVLAEQPATNRNGPSFVRFPLGSWCAAWLATIGITARLAAARRGAPPGPVDTSLLQGAMVPLMMRA